MIGVGYEVHVTFRNPDEVYGAACMVTTPPADQITAQAVVDALIDRYGGRGARTALTDLDIWPETLDVTYGDRTAIWPPDAHGNIYTVGNDDGPVTIEIGFEAETEIDPEDVTDDLDGVDDIDTVIGRFPRRWRRVRSFIDDFDLLPDTITVTVTGPPAAHPDTPEAFPFVEHPGLPGVDTPPARPAYVTTTADWPVP